jgi:hypothetical protein
MTTFEFLDEHLYQLALKGWYQAELNLVQGHLPALRPFQTPAELMHAVRKDRPLRQKVIRELEYLWQENYDLRPASGVILVGERPGGRRGLLVPVIYRTGKGGAYVPRTAA